MRCLTRLTWAAVLSLTLVGGCADRVTMENYSKITPGMTRAQVIEILGEPSNSYQGVANWNSRDPAKSITVTFVEGKVLDKTLRGLEAK